ncbi:MAG: lipopolysaccharide A protein [Enterobacteriaceae bacterium]|jgi:hypothetical protein|nr:lipopolysaccharide A protein [Enterobacteriaceae bacterium]
MRVEKVPFYARNIIKDVIPGACFRAQLPSLLASIDASQWEYIQQRVNYYNKLTKPFTLDETAIECRKLSVWGHPSTYYYDLMDTVRYFSGSKRVSYHFGDIKHVPERPTFVKTRPIGDHNENSILLKLNQIRHFNFYTDNIPFDEKLNMAVFRGACYQDTRKLLLDKFGASSVTDIADTGRHDGQRRRNLMSETDQMKYKFIISIEGNDVATNLKWIMHSNSLCLMRKPRIESWFMENFLIPDHHYILLKDDFSDLEEKIAYYSEHSDEAKQITRNANQYVSQFLDKKRELIISLLVMQKYFDLSGQ